MQEIKQWFTCAAKGNLNLLKEGLKGFVGQRDQQGNTALMVAAMNNHLQCIEFLAPFELDLFNNDGLTAEQIAQQVGNVEAANLLNSAKIPYSPLYIRCNVPLYMDEVRRDNQQYVQQNFQFFMKQRDIRPQFQGWTALMHAAAADACNVGRILIQQELKLKTPQGRTALQICCENKSKNILELLLAEAGVQDEYGWSALMYAVDSGFSDGVACLKAVEQKLKNCFGLRAEDIARMRNLDFVE